MRDKTHSQDATPQPDTAPACLPLDTPANADVHTLRTHNHTLRDTPSRNNQDGEDQAEGDLGCGNIPTPRLLQHNCWCCGVALRTGLGSGTPDQQASHQSISSACLLPRPKRINKFLPSSQDHRRAPKVHSQPYQVQKRRQQGRNCGPILQMRELRPSMEKQLIRSHPSREKPS